MNELQVFRRSGVEVVDSREVARMVEKRHDHLIRDISGYIKVMESNAPNFGEVGNERKILPVDFFIPSTYQDGKGETRPCYLLTKKGCDMVANKMTGEKGVLFTAAYVTAFEKMRERAQKSQLSPDKAALAEAKLNNSRARLSSVWLKIASTNPIPEYKQICTHYASAVLAGKEVLPLPEVTGSTYSAAEVGAMLGGISANRVGRLANANKLKTPEYGVEVWDKSRSSAKQVPTWRYNDKAVARLRDILRSEAAQ